jgi:Fe-S-cluster containining protein
MDSTEKSKGTPSTQLCGAPKKQSINACIRCAICCTKGGPSFHHADKHLIERGVIHSRYLYTLRQGELAYDNVKGCLVPVDSDIIKIKGQPGSWMCHFFNADQQACRIYKHRPLECRVLKCWDTRELEAIYALDRLTRQDLVSDIAGLWELVNDHQERCDYVKIQKLVNALYRHKNKAAQRQLIEIVQYDMEIRKLVVSKGGLDEDMLDFLLGRPLMKTIESYGARLRLSGKKIALLPASEVKEHQCSAD